MVPTSTTVPTATPVTHYTAAPVINESRTVFSLGSQFWQETAVIDVPVGDVGRDFVIKARVKSPHDKNQALWSWGVGLTRGGETESIYVKSNGTVGTVKSVFTKISTNNYTFSINTTQNVENDIEIRSWNGLVSVFVNGTLAAEITGLWDEPGSLSVGANYGSTEIAQGFVMIVEDISAVSSSIARNERFDIEVKSEVETLMTLPTGELKEISASFENPFSVNREILDFGVRIGLPESNRHLNITQITSPTGNHIVKVSVTFDHNGSTYWSRNISLSNYDTSQLDIRLTKANGNLKLVVDGFIHQLNDIGLDFNFDKLQNVEFFVNSDKIIVDSRDARFVQSPYVRITEFGLWND